MGLHGCLVSEPEVARSVRLRKVGVYVCKDEGGKDKEWRRGEERENCGRGTEDGDCD